MADLMIHREALQISAFGKVSIYCDFTTLEAYFQCVTCYDELLWNEERKMSECPECGYELTAEEANRLCTDYVMLVRTLVKEVHKERGWLWRLVRWFKGLRLISTSSKQLKGL